MMHVGIFTGYYPYGVVETARRIRAAILPSARTAS